VEGCRRRLMRGEGLKRKERKCMKKIERGERLSGELEGKERNRRWGGGGLFRR
jgi:hypothetical protein